MGYPENKGFMFRNLPSLKLEEIDLVSLNSVTPNVLRPFIHYLSSNSFVYLVEKMRWRGTYPPPPPSA